ncbi:DUF6544 family protein [Microvirga arsenatis]|uniref:DUF6544 family protein n=1 Tax=Microvirga arsenatis TaxID=2692265 RepID=UPI003CCEA260
MRFWLLDTVPVVRAKATPDLVRSAQAKAFAEALWAPASLLPANGVILEPIDANRARAVLRHDGESFALELTVAENGRPLSVAMQRWTTTIRSGPSATSRRALSRPGISACGPWPVRSSCWWCGSPVSGPTCHCGSFSSWPSCWRSLPPGWHGASGGDGILRCLPHGGGPSAP